MGGWKDVPFDKDEERLEECGNDRETLGEGEEGEEGGEEVGGLGEERDDCWKSCFFLLFFLLFFLWFVEEDEETMLERLVERTVGVGGWVGGWVGGSSSSSFLGVGGWVGGWVFFLLFLFLLRYVRKCFLY